MTGGHAHAPAAPGSLGADVPDTELLAYLDAMLRWKDRRRTELAALDEAALEVTDPGERAALTPDVTLSMTLWQAVADRLALILATWDSGRVGEQERRRTVHGHPATVWGRAIPSRRLLRKLLRERGEACCANSHLNHRGVRPWRSRARAGRAARG